MLYLNRLKLSIYFNSGYPITLGNHEFLQLHILDYKSKVKYISTYVPIYSFSNKILIASKFINLDIFMDSTNKLGLVTVKVTIEVYIINHLKANILVNISILNIYSISLDLGTQEAVIAKCNRIKILIYSVTKPYSQLRRVIKMHHAVTIAPNLIIDIPIIYHNIFPKDRNFLFKP